MVEDHCTTYVRSDNDGNVILSIRNDGEKEGSMRCVLAFGSDYNKAVDAVMYRAREIFTASQQVSPPVDLKPDWFETWVDGFAYCTWNGLGRELTEKKIMDCLQDLQDHGIKGGRLITI
jgi:hypothetical protein